MRNPDRIDTIANILCSITNEDLSIMDILIEQDIGYYTEDEELISRLEKYPKIGYNIYANKLCYYWKMNCPDLRFGQLILNVFSNYTDISDAILANTIEKFYDKNTDVADIDCMDIFLENFT